MKLGFIGLGLMGGSMAANLQKAGHELVLHDLRRAAAEPLLEKGATWAASPAELAGQVDLIFTSLPGPPEFEAVATQILAGAREGLTLVDLSTNSPTMTRRMEEVFRQHGAHLLESPVSGGPQGAASGKLALWVGGDEQMFERHRPVLDAIGDQVMYIGPMGAAAVAKLVHNLSGYVVNAAMAEAFTMGVKAGVDPLHLWKAVRQGANGRRRTFDSLADQFLPGIYDPARFALKLAHKDVSLATGVGKELGVPMRLSNMALEEMTEALGRGWAARDSRSAMLLQQERAGVSIQVPRAEIDAVLAADKPG